MTSSFYENNSQAIPELPDIIGIKFGSRTTVLGTVNKHAIDTLNITSNREITSLISFTKNLRTFDESAQISSLKNISSTYTNLNRLIGLKYELEEYLDSEENLNLDELLSIFKEKYTDELDFTELKESVYDHNCDMELRHRILQLVALKLLYSRNTIPERGYERAKRFINEFNKKLGLTLSAEQIDEIIHRDYTNGEKWEHVLKTYVDEDGEEHSYWTVEDVAKKEQPKEESKRIKRLAKRMFNKNR